jgi:uncharacterized RDD family membrane protein YckC
MNVQEVFIHEVLSRVPPGRRRAQIDADLRAHLAERVEHGESIEEAIRQFGDPADLADSYLAAIPLVSASFGARVLARLVDFAAIAAVTCATLWTAWQVVGPRGVPFGRVDGFWAEPIMLGLIILLGVVLCPGYFVVGEYYTGETLGKRAMSIHVVRESGARITIGQALLRSLPLFASFFLLDVVFALFTEKNQRAFELISKTRVVLNDEDAG